MYHHVRNFEHTRFPAFKGLTVDQFKEQLDYLQRYYVIVAPTDVIAAANGRRGDLPRNAALLTFDEGYIDHYTNVFPILMERKLSAMFFPTVRGVRERRLVDIDKIHFIIACADDPRSLERELIEALGDFNNRGIANVEDYKARFSRSTRWDPPEVTFVKQMLQWVLPKDVREAILTRMLEHFVGIDEDILVHDLYLNTDQLKVMMACGMFVGSHSTTHPWLNTLDSEEQAAEIDTSLTFLSELGVPLENWVMCYPSGTQDENLLRLLRERNCALGLTSEAKIADLEQHDPLLLPRLDTNDLPKMAGSPPNEWTRKVLD
jgi:peptidoglycan/xylan/chitin deacetylase (PgdA/CDA1 family)